MVHIGAKLMIPGSAWTDCDPSRWYAGQIVAYDDKGLSLVFEDSEQEYSFEYDELKTYASLYRHTVDKLLTTVKEEYGMEAAHALSSALEEHNECDVKEIVKAFAAQYAESLVLRCNADLMSAVGLVDSCLV